MIIFLIAVFLIAVAIACGKRVAAKLVLFATAAFVLFWVGIAVWLLTWKPPT